jgi:hypothetical protein
VRSTEHSHLTLSFRHMTRERGIAASLYLAAAVLALGSFAWGWGHLTYPKTSTSLAVAAVGHRPVTIGYAIFMFLGAIRVGTLEARGTNLQRWLGLSALVTLVMVGYATYDVVAERSAAISKLVANTASSLHLPVSAVQAEINRQVSEGLVKFSFAPGIYLAFVACLVGALAVSIARRAIVPVQDVPKDAHPGWVAPLPPPPNGS